MNIRTATINDVARIKRLYWELDADAVRFQPEHFLQKERPDNFVLEGIVNDHSDYLLIGGEGKVVGFALVQMKENTKISCLKQQKYLYVSDIVVTKEMRGKGFGTRLLEECRQYGLQRGADFMKLSCFPKNRKGIHFYKKNGFSEMMKTLECPLKPEG